MVNHYWTPNHYEIVVLWCLIIGRFLMKMTCFGSHSAHCFAQREYFPPLSSKALCLLFRHFKQREETLLAFAQVFWSDIEVRYTFPLSSKALIRYPTHFHLLILRPLVSRQDKL